MPLLSVLTYRVVAILKVKYSVSFLFDFTGQITVPVLHDFSFIYKMCELQQHLSSGEEVVSEAGQISKQLMHGR